MKTRNGFVSNSSSTSFIIANAPGKNNISGKIKLTVEVDLSEYITDTIKNKKELLKLFKEDYDWSPDSESDWSNCTEIFMKASLAIDAGKVVYFGLLSDEGMPTEAIETLLCHKGLDGFESEDDTFKVIQSEAGY